MPKICTKNAVISHGIIWLKETFVKYVPRCEHTKYDKYVIKGGGGMDKWVNVNIYTMQTKKIKILDGKKTQGKFI